jgi:hypothetical protein
LPLVRTARGGAGGLGIRDILRDDIEARFLGREGIGTKVDSRN